jgi:hypothetical protein
MGKIKSIGLCAALVLALTVVGAQAVFARGGRHSARHEQIVAARQQAHSERAMRVATGGRAQARRRAAVTRSAARRAVHPATTHGTVLVLKANGQIVPNGALVHVTATGYLFKSKISIEGTGAKQAKEEEVECETEYFEQGKIQRNLAANQWRIVETAGVDFCEGETWFGGHEMNHPLVFTAPNIMTDESNEELFRTEEQIKEEKKSEFEHSEPIHAREPVRCLYNTIGGKGHFKSKKGAPIVAKLKGKMLRSASSSPGCSEKAKWKGTFSLTYNGHPISAAMEVAPTVTSVIPMEAPEAGTTVTIGGTGFTGATAVQFGAANAASFTVNSDSSITAVAPAGTGTVDVRVTTPVTETAITPADRFTYAVRPTVSGVSPKEGSETGGTTVMVTGTNFTSGSTVHFGASAATNVKVSSTSSLSAVSPAGTGSVNISVTNAGGTSSANTADKFTYRPGPTVTAISPKEGPEAGKTTVTIKGTHFLTGAEVKFGTNSATNVKLKSETELEAESPAGSGTVHVTVTTGGGTSTTSAADEFTYLPAPSVTAISPKEGPEAGKTTVTITGSHFLAGAEVKFGTNSATNVKVKSETEIEAESPAGSGTVHVTVTTANGTSTTSSADEFAYRPVPTVSEVSPNTGAEAGGTPVVIKGTGFFTGAEVKFGTNNATNVKVKSQTEIEAESPAGTGTVHVTVTTAGGTSTTSSSDEFTY